VDHPSCAPEHASEVARGYLGQLEYREQNEFRLSEFYCQCHLNPSRSGQGRHVTAGCLTLAAHHD